MTPYNDLVWDETLADLVEKHRTEGIASIKAFATTVRWKLGLPLN